VGDRPAVAFDAVDIVFGGEPARALPLMDRGRSREEILEATGQILGVTNASLEVERGHICVLMGLSGSGKSTLLRAVNGLNRVARGRVLVADGERDVDVGRCDRATLRHLRTTRIAMVFQQFGLLPWRTVADNVGFGLEVKGVPRQQRDRVVQEKLALVHLDAWAGKRVDELSGGMQQRVGLARALATDADILLMDEPFSALDPLIRVRLQDELLELQRRLGKTIVFVSHDLEEALKIGSTIAIMEGGRIVQTGPPEVIVTRPATDYVRDFVANVNPLSVLTLSTVLKPLTDLEPEGAPGERLWIDRRTRLHAELEHGGGLHRVVGDGLPLRLIRELGGNGATPLPYDTIFLATPEAPVRLAVEAIRVTGWPVCVVDGDGRLLGRVGIDEILGCLGGRRDPPGGPPLNKA
jgi:glycine betaine/proline transport system ATP-binding protein